MLENIEKYWFLVPSDTEVNSIPGRDKSWCSVTAHTQQFTNTEHALFITCGACPYPSDPRHKKCSSCTRNLAQTNIIFMNTITRWPDILKENVITDFESIPLEWVYHYKETRLSAPLFETCLNGRLDVFGAEISAGYKDTVLFHNCGTCRSPMNSRVEECFYCIQNGAKTVHSVPDFVILMKIITREFWPPVDKSVFSIGEKFLGMTEEDVERINEIIDSIENTDNLYEKIALCNEGLKINDTVAVLWGLKGEFLYYAHKFEDAYSCYEKAVLLDPDNDVIWSNKGFILKTLGKLEDALKCFEKALSLNPYDVHASTQRETCLRALGRPVTSFDETKFYGKCPSCGIDVPVHAKFCYKCGHPIGSRTAPEKQCLQCGCTIPVTAQFCPYCGGNVGGDFTRLY
jgi:hypothetical protein